MGHHLTAGFLHGHGRIFPLGEEMVRGLHHRGPQQGSEEERGGDPLVVADTLVGIGQCLLHKAQVKAVALVEHGVHQGKQLPEQTVFPQYPEGCQGVT